MNVSAFALPGLPEITAGDDLARQILVAAERAGGLHDGDIVAIAQKAISKAEGRRVELDSIVPSDKAWELAKITDKDPRLVEVILEESEEVLRAREGVLIVRTRQGFVCANAGIDQSNLPGDDVVLMLPLDSDASARAIRSELADLTGCTLAVLVTDSFGRAWRVGQQDVAIGCAGLVPVIDQRGGADREGRVLTATQVAVADELAAAADLARHKSSGEPVVLVRGRADLVSEADGPGALKLLRDRSADLFS
ncbi:MAG: coenzyme F420-0:L-glutamate ligase [Solirubrobacterales bacterium]